jgi:fatty-acyl-CoA synthase
MEFNLADLYEIVADAVPDRPALVAGDRRLTYAQLDERANRFAHYLLDHGVEPGDNVAIYSWDRAEWVEAMLGTYKARAVPINVNYRYVADEARYILDNSDAVVVVHERAFAPVVNAIRGDLPSSATRSFSRTARARRSTQLPTRRAGGGVAGSDFEPRSRRHVPPLYRRHHGRPEGRDVAVRGHLLAALGGGGFGQPPITKPEELADRIPAEAPGHPHGEPPMMHGGGQWMAFINPSSAAGPWCSTATATSTRSDLAHGRAERCNSVMVVGDAMGRPLAEALSAPERRTTPRPSSSSVGRGDPSSGKEQLRAQLPNAMVMDSFGASETGASGTVLDTEGPAAGPRFTMGEFMTVLDDDLRPAAPGAGVVGRLARRGHIPLGYYKDDEKTAATFVIAADAARWAVPGDLAVVETTAPSPCSAGARVSTPAARRCIPRRSRRC